MFAPVPATQRRAGRARPPGRSATRVSSTSRRPASVSWRRATEASSPASTLPPESTATVVPVAAARPGRRAAPPRRPRRRPRRRACSAPSAAPSPRRSRPRRRPRSRRRHCGEQRSVSSPGCLTAIPSAIVSAESAGTGSPRAQRLRVRRAGGDLHADHLDLRPRGLDRDRDARAQPAAADRHDHLGEVRARPRAARARASPGRRRCPGRRTGARTRARPRRARSSAASTHSSTESPPMCTSRPGRAPPRPWRAARRSGT